MLKLLPLLLLANFAYAELANKPDVRIGMSNRFIVNTDIYILTMAG